MLSRTEYFRDLLEDCVIAARQAEIDNEDMGAVIAALVLSDSYNGLRKALLQIDSLRPTLSYPPRQV
jgi:hypothetical protein